jgi:hypothetical protein
MVAKAGLLMESCKIRVFGNRVLRGIFGPEREGVRKDCKSACLEAS